MKCVTSTSFSIVVNGESCGFFREGRGLRQGDPMSPYLFTLVMEILNLLMVRKVGSNRSFQYYFGCNKLKITHICFADDLLMFCHGDVDSIRIIKEFIKEFGDVSRLLPNYSKSTIIFGSVNDEDRQRILDICPFKVESIPVKYLGVPLITKRLRVKDCKSLVHKSIQVYWATIFLLPQAVIDDINRLLKAKGGLGLKNLSIWNKAMIIKHLWHVAADKDSLWVKWINTFKLKGKIVWEINEDINDSWGWRNILKMRQEARMHMFMKVGNGSKTSVWFDFWSNMGVLNDNISFRDIYDARMEIKLTVKEIYEKYKGQWPEELRNKFPLITQVSNITLTPDKDDELMWKRNNGVLRKFSVREPHYSRQDQKMRKSEVKINGSDWGSIIQELASMQNGNSIGSVVRRLCLAASIYLIWQERNNRFFKSVKRNVEELFTNLVDTVTQRLCSLKVKRTKAVDKVKTVLGLIKSVFGERNYFDNGDPTSIYHRCGAMLWHVETLRGNQNGNNNAYSLCCGKGKVQLPKCPDPSHLLSNLYRSKHLKSKNFIKNIRAYNMMFSFTSMGGKVDSSVNKGRGPYVYNLQG
ncbi:RNA-directed DNA polymerase, eukaryota, reverse transcriptase zinc-binding domain protein [Tanacetum coccineum]